MERTREDAIETIRRIISIWIEGDPKAPLSTRVRRLPGRHRIDRIPRGFLPHLFLVVVESESADPIAGNELTIDSTLGEVINWLASKPVPQDEDALEWSVDAEVLEQFIGES